MWTISPEPRPVVAPVIALTNRNDKKNTWICSVCGPKLLVTRYACPTITYSTGCLTQQRSHFLALPRLGVPVSQVVGQTDSLNRPYTSGEDVDILCLFSRQVLADLRLKGSHPLPLFLIASSERCYVRSPRQATNHGSRVLTP